MRKEGPFHFLQLETIFGCPKHSNIVFCIDASDREKDVKTIIFQHVIAYLHQTKFAFSDCKFNVVLFGEKASCNFLNDSIKVTKFASDMQLITNRNITELERWMCSSELGQMSFAVPGLIETLANTEFCSIYFITDGYFNDVRNCLFNNNVFQEVSILQSEISKINNDHDFCIFLICEQLPPEEKSLLMFRELATNNPEAWGAITLITKKRQAENLKLTTFSMSSTETTSTGMLRNCAFLSWMLQFLI